MAIPGPAAHVRGAPAGAAIAIVVRPYWLSSWFLRLFAVPVVLVDGAEHRARWNEPLRLEVPTGLRRVGAAVRYRGTHRLLGHRPISVDASPGTEVRLLARNGPLNSDPFRVRVLP